MEFAWLGSLLDQARDITASAQGGEDITQRIAILRGHVDELPDDPGSYRSIVAVNSDAIQHVIESLRAAVDSLEEGDIVAAASRLGPTPKRKPEPLFSHARRGIEAARVGVSIDLSAARAQLAEMRIPPVPLDDPRVSHAQRTQLEHQLRVVDEYSRCFDLIDAGEADAAQEQLTAAISLAQKHP